MLASSCLIESRLDLCSQFRELLRAHVQNFTAQVGLVRLPVRAGSPLRSVDGECPCERVCGGDKSVRRADGVVRVT